MVFRFKHTGKVGKSFNPPKLGKMIDWALTLLNWAMILLCSS